jgi:hypothetical protein
MKKNTSILKQKTLTFNPQDYSRPGVSNDEIAELK